jgi:putative transposase
VLDVSCSGFYAWRFRPPSARAVRHAWLTDVIREVHTKSYGTYGAKRVYAELVLGRGIQVGHNAVAMLMQRAGIAGRSGARKRYGIPSIATADDLVDRMFVRERPNRLWPTDITEHPTREGKVYCAIVLDALSRFTSWAFTERARQSGLVPSMGSIGDSYDNAMIEAFWSRMQVELLDTRRWKTRVELANAIFEYIEIFHNRRRRDSSLGMLTPIEFELKKTNTTRAAA